MPDAEWVRALRAQCTAAGAALIFDEIQTGFGRTGTLFAFERFGVVPDILTLAKAMGGGMPIGAFISSPERMAVLRNDPPLSHVTTFGGHPVSCAAADAALEVLVDEQLYKQAGAIEEAVRELESHPSVREVRGIGAMLGLVLPDARVTQRFVAACLEHGVLLGWTLHADNLVRVAPPLNIGREVLRDALDVMRGALDFAPGG